jgi:peptidoglycan/xylan/chitin deacetylase (PgdA/CDA1 family)
LTPSSRRSRRLSLVATSVVACSLAVAASLPASAAQPNAEIVTSTRHDGRWVALTFDDGPNPADPSACSRC